MSVSEAGDRWLWKSHLLPVLAFLLLCILFTVLFVAGALIVAGAMSGRDSSEPGLVSDATGLLVIVLVNLIVISSLILTSRWSGWRLALGLSFSYYGAVTVVMQVETWYFLSASTLPPELLPRLFLMGIPTAFVFIPIAVWTIGRRGNETLPPVAAQISPAEWCWKLPVLAFSYVILYWSAGYFIAWQNPQLRAFYGHHGDPLPFLAHTAATIRQDPFFFPFQLLRGLLWVVCGLPVIRGSRVGPWWTAMIVGCFFSVPQNVVHITANAWLPLASVRMSHLIETAASTFLFGALCGWLLHRPHRSFGDLFGRAVPM